VISEKIQKAFNDQINAEMFSAYLYLAMGAYFEDLNMPGFANWMKVQASEEIDHAMKFFNHIIERDGRVELQPIDGPPKGWDSPLAAFQAAYDHECYISSRINDLVKLSYSENDYPSYSLLQWFVDEQVEEEASTKTIADQLEMIGDRSVGALFMLERELGKRSFSVPPALSGGDE
jgi:ferritin